MEQLNRSKKRAFNLSAVAIAVAVCLLSFPCRSEIQFDGSVGAGGVHDAEQFGNSHNIYDTDGQIVGGNLFYSFSHFNLPSGESVNFYNYSPTSLDNVISRVTGGEPSQLNGSFNSFIPNASFWFINPAGVIFGDQASLNINGSFHVSTADYLKFADGQRWETTTATTPVLSSATPEAFGFLNGHPAGISFYGTGSGLAEYYLGIKFSVQEGKTLAIVGGDIAITGKHLGMVDVESRLKAPGGRVAIASVASAGEVDLSKESLGAESFSKLGKIKMDAGSYVDASGEGAGEIVIRGGELTLDNAALVSDTKGQADGKRIDIDVRGNMDFSTNGAGIYARTFGDGKGADVKVVADTLTLADSALITASTDSNGKGGDISVNANTLNLTGGASIKTQKGNYSTGEGGQLAIQADTINLNEKALVASDTGDGSENKGGDILITANNDMTLSGGAAVSSGTGLFGDAKGGDVMVDVKGQLTIKDGVATSPSGIYSNAGDGDAGKLNVKAKNLTLENGAAIGGDNFSAGRGADIDIHVEENLSLQSDASKPNSSAWISAKSSLALAQSGIFPTGAPGNINISANTLSFSGPRSGITTFSFSNNNDAGDVTLKAKSLELGDHARIEGSTGGYYGKGKAADFLFQVEHLTLSGGAQINSSSSTEGAAGDIRVENAKTLDIQGNSTDGISGVYSASFWKGNAGHISISASDINLRDYSEISTSTNGLGHGGDIELKNAENIVLSGRGDILSRTYGFLAGNAAAGDISVTTDQLTLKDGFWIDTNTQGDGNAGNISIKANGVNISGNSRITSDNFLLDSGNNLFAVGKGDAGTIDIAANSHITIDDASKVSTSTASEGVAGKVSLDGGEAIAITNMSFVGSSSLRGAKGAAGSVNLTAKQVSVSDAGAVFAETYDGKGGSIEINADELSLERGGAVSTSTYGQGQAGNILIHGKNQQASQQVSINGMRDDLSFPLPDGRDVTGQASGIYLNTLGTGNGGNLDLQTQHLKISDGGLISAVVAFGSSAQTHGGDITIQAESIDLQSGGLISAATSGIGKAGNVNVKATDSLGISGTFDRTRHANVTNPRISDHSGINNSARFIIDNRAQHLGSSGSITVKAGSLSLTDGGEISVANEGTDSGSVGGSIIIDADERFYSRNGRISAATASAEGGDITLKAQDMIHLVDSQISTSVAGGKGSGGNINIDPQFLILDNSQITAQALQGAGGNIKIIAEHFIATPDSIISASSQFGVDGKVIIDSPDTNMLGKIATLTTKFLDPATLFKEQCEARYNAGLSSLSVMVADVKAAPGESYLMATPESTTSNSLRSCQKPIQLEVTH